mgnify:CR=1 FL=1
MAAVCEGVRGCRATNSSSRGLRTDVQPHPRRHNHNHNHNHHSTHITLQWKNRACRLFDYVLSFLEDAGDDVAVWIDILAVTQHADSPQQRHDVSAAAFAATVAGCGGGTLVVLDREMTSPATRGWCIFEW